MTGGLPALWWPLARDTAAGSLLLFGIALAAARCQRRAPAALRHRIWGLFLASLLAVPVLSIALPHWKVALPAVVAPPAGFAPVRGRFHGGGAGRVAGFPAAPGQRGAPARAAGALDLAPLLFVTWLIGAAAALVRPAASLVAVRRWCRGSVPVAEGIVLELAQAAAARLAVRRPVLVRQNLPTAPPVAPSVWGVIRPVILLPTVAAEWPVTRLRMVLLHEFAHVAHHDLAAQRLAELATAVYWFHPGVWYAAARLRREAERACDDRVLAEGVGAVDYARELVAILRGLETAPTLQGAASMISSLNPFDRPPIQERLNALLDARTDRRPLSRRTRLRSGIAAAALVAALGTIGYGSPLRAGRHPRHRQGARRFPDRGPPSQRRGRPGRTAGNALVPRSAARPRRDGPGQPEAPEAGTRAPAPAGADGELDSLRRELSALRQEFHVAQARVAATERRAQTETSLLEKQLELIDHRLAELNLAELTRPERDRRAARRLKELEQERDALLTFVRGGPQILEIEAQIRAERVRTEELGEDAELDAMTIGRLTHHREELVQALSQVLDRQAGLVSNLRERAEALTDRIRILEDRLRAPQRGRPGR